MVPSSKLASTRGTLRKEKMEVVRPKSKGPKSKKSKRRITPLHEDSAEFLDMDSIALALRNPKRKDTSSPKGGKQRKGEGKGERKERSENYERPRQKGSAYHVGGVKTEGVKGGIKGGGVGDGKGAVLVKAGPGGRHLLFSSFFCPKRKCQRQGGVRKKQNEEEEGEEGEEGDEEGDEDKEEEEEEEVEEEEEEEEDPRGFNKIDLESFKSKEFARETCKARV